MDPKSIIDDHYRPGDPLTDILLNHGQRVQEKALAVANRSAHLKPDVEFISQAALLHDIGIYRTTAPSIHCSGTYPYVRHGILGRQILEEYGLTRHALVCERHVGVGITRADIESQQLPLPLRDMMPISLEETIVCYADKFFSKTNGVQERSLTQVAEELARYGQDKVDRFMAWHRSFGG